MEWQGSNNDGPLSPKKKLHLKAKGGSLSDKVQDVRNDLKNAKDISARNLLANLEKDNDHSNENSNNTDDESSVEEVMVIEEETTEYVSEAEEECEEEIIEEEYYEEVEEVTDSEGSDLEPLPPPIAIPKALQVKDSNHGRENSDDEDEEEEDDDDDDDEEEQVVVPPPAVVTPAKRAEEPLVTQHKPAQEAKQTPSAASQPKSNLRPSAIRGKSFEETPPSPKQPAVVVPDDDDEEEEDTDPTDSPVVESAAPVTPKTPTSSYATVPASSFVTPTKPPAPTVAAAVATNEDLDENGRPKVEWTKPDWTKNTKLRATGKSAAGNLAKPITNLPHMGKKNQDDTTILSRSSHHHEEQDQVAPAVTTSPSSTSFKTPTASNKAKVTSAVVTAAVAPKSAPQVRKPPAAVVVVNRHANDDNADAHALPPAIGWEKPDWAKKTVLRPTDKSDKIKSGQKLERPIGGIKPVD
jgi:hypothetical protein